MTTWGAILLKLAPSALKPVIDGYLRRQSRYRTAADEFKFSLLPGIENFRADETTFSALVLSYFPEHNRAFERFLIVAPKADHAKLRERWATYRHWHESLRQAGLFGVAIAMLPHEDFGTSPEMVIAVERKNKKEVLRVLQGFLDHL